MTSDVDAAARGLRRRGLGQGDVVAVWVDDMRDRELAARAAEAAGARVVHPGPGIGWFRETAARILIVDEKRAEEALAAVEISRIRQVFVFGHVPGASPFSELMGGDLRINRQA